MKEKMPKRDITGECDEGECRDRVKEGEKDNAAAVYLSTLCCSSVHRLRVRNRPIRLLPQPYVLSYFLSAVICKERRPA